ncbi:MAG: hypothetical protein ACN2B6_03200 [Rickettsiales bacterium]
MSEENNSTGCGAMSWWATLIIAVLAVPSFGVVVAFMSPLTGFAQLIVFVLACWLCTYLGMRLMSNPKMHEKICKKD